jgi:O-antigen ligase
MSALYLDRFEGASFENPDATAEWRADWWANLYEGVMNRNPLIGLGFGENLSDYNALITAENIGTFPVRSPHNYNVTIFSRMGILGLTIWVGIFSLGIVIPLGKLMRPFSPAERTEARDRTFWIAAIIAIWVNSSFGVLMEGPVDGIPFWLILGLIAGQANSRARKRRFYSADQVAFSRGIDHPPGARVLSGVR